MGATSHAQTQESVNARVRKTRAKSLAPAVTHTQRASVINRTALELLTQDGEEYVAVHLRDGKLILKPLAIDGAVKVARIVRVENGRAFVRLGIDQPNGRYAARWNDVDGALEIDLSAPMLRGARSARA